MEKRGGKASSLSETMSLTCGKQVCVVQGLLTWVQETYGMLKSELDMW
jgi:hypothetical protein